MVLTHRIEFTPQQLKDMTDLLRIEAGRFAGRPGYVFLGKIYEDLYETIKQQWRIDSLTCGNPRK